MTQLDGEQAFLSEAYFDLSLQWHVDWGAASAQVSTTIFENLKIMIAHLDANTCGTPRIAEGAPRETPSTGRISLRVTSVLLASLLNAVEVRLNVSSGERLKSQQLPYRLSLVFMTGAGHVVSLAADSHAARVRPHEWVDELPMATLRATARGLTAATTSEGVPPLNGRRPPPRRVFLQSPIR